MTLNLEDNLVNRTLSPDQPKIKLWRSVGLMLSYWCSSRCSCCYVFSGPDARDCQTEMSIDLALQCWRGIRRLAGDRGRVHLTGGEPFGDYDRLRDLLRAAQAEGLTGLEKIETNAYWCTDEDLTRDRLQELKSLGMTKLQISSDIYHQQYVPLERVRLAVRVAQDVLEPDNMGLPQSSVGDNHHPGLQVRWRDFLDEPELVGDLTLEQRQAAFARTLHRRGERMLGRAAEELAFLMPTRPCEQFADDNCTHSILGAAHVHIDGAANIFLGTCVGIIAANANSTPLDEAWRRFDYRENPILSVLAQSGPTGLLPQAEKLGYQRLSGYASKCHLCYELRRFLFQRKNHKECLGPAVCYGLKSNP